MGRKTPVVPSCNPGCGKPHPLLPSSAMHSALSIAGSDPTGGAGMQADLQTFALHGVRGAGVVSALTIQDSVRVHSVLPVFPSVVLDQIRTLLADLTPDAIKIGMLATDDVARNVVLGLQSVRDKVPIVIDPVLEASDGTLLLERRAWPALHELIRGCHLVTPNLNEAERLSGMDCSRRKDCEKAAEFFIRELGAGAVLLKGGHRSGSPDDLLAVGGGTETRFTWLEGERIESGPVHGTGCALASSVAAGLARGQSLEDAVRRARAFVREGIASASEFGRGARHLGLPGDLS